MSGSGSTPGLRLVSITLPYSLERNPQACPLPIVAQLKISSLKSKFTSSVRRENVIYSYLSIPEEKWGDFIQPHKHFQGFHLLEELRNKSKCGVITKTNKQTNKTLQVPYQTKKLKQITLQNELHQKRKPWIHQGRSRVWSDFEVGEQLEEIGCHHSGRKERKEEGGRRERERERKSFLQNMERHFIRKDGGKWERRKNRNHVQHDGIVMEKKENTFRESHR